MVVHRQQALINTCKVVQCTKQQHKKIEMKIYKWAEKQLIISPFMIEYDFCTLHHFTGVN